MLSQVIVTSGVVKEPSPIFSTFFQTFEILLWQESSYFSHNPWKILQPKGVQFEDINEKLSSYDNHY